MFNQSLILLPPHIRDLIISSKSIIQSNSQGFANKKAEVMDLISEEKRYGLCIRKNAPKSGKFHFKLLQWIIQRFIHKLQSN